MKNYPISNAYVVEDNLLDWNIVSQSLAATSNKSVLFIQSKCNTIPVWDSYVVDSRGRVIQLNLIHFVALLSLLDVCTPIRCTFIYVVYLYTYRVYLYMYSLLIHR